MAGIFQKIGDTLAAIFSKDMLMILSEIGGILAVFGLLSGFLPTFPFGVNIIAAMSSDPIGAFLVGFSATILGGVLSIIFKGLNL
jgi:hypothetical protein